MQNTDERSASAQGALESTDAWRYRDDWAAMEDLSRDDDDGDGGAVVIAIGVAGLLGMLTGFGLSYLLPWVLS